MSKNPFFLTAKQKVSRKLVCQAKLAGEKRRAAVEKANLFAERNGKMSVELETLRDAVRDYITVQDRWLKSVDQNALLPGDWVRAYRRMKRAMVVRGAMALTEKRAKR